MGKKNMLIMLACCLIPLVVLGAFSSSIFLLAKSLLSTSFFETKKHPYILRCFSFSGDEFGFRRLELLQKNCIPLSIL